MKRARLEHKKGYQSRGTAGLRSRAVVRRWRAAGRALGDLIDCGDDVSGEDPGLSKRALELRFGALP